MAVSKSLTVSINSLLLCGFVSTATPPQPVYAQEPAPAQYLVKGKPVSENVYRAMVLSNEVRNLLINNQLDKALANCEKAVELAPDVPEVQCNLGTTLARLGRGEEAIQHLEKAVALDPNIAGAVMTLGSLYQSVGRTQEAIKTLKDFQKRFPNHEYSAKVKSLLAILETELNAQTQRGETPGSAPQADYFSAVTFGTGVTKWIPARMPIKVYLAPWDKVPGYKPVYGELVKSAFDEWTAASGGKVKFSYVEDKATSDITFAFSNDVKSVSSPAEGGEAKVYPGANGIQKANIIVLTLNPTPEHQLTPEMMRWICLHEIGHSLGLLGHSSQPSDVMYSSIPIASNNRGLSERDRNTIAHLYSDDVAIKRPTTSDLGASASSPTALNNEGAIALQSGDLETGISKLEKALKLDPTLKVAKENLAQAYSIRAMRMVQNGNQQEAEPWFKKGLSLVENAKTPQGTNVVRSYAMFLRLSKRYPEAQKVEAMLK